MRKSERFIFTAFDDCKVLDFLYLIRHKPLSEEPFLKYCPWVVRVLCNHTSTKTCNKHFHHSDILQLHTVMFRGLRVHCHVVNLVCIIHLIILLSEAHLDSKQEIYNI